MEASKTAEKPPLEPSDGVNIINNYYNFDTHDIELENIKQSLNLSEESIAEILSLETSFEAQFEKNLLNNVYPYLKNVFYALYSKVTQPKDKLYLLLIILSKKEVIEHSLINCYKFLINSNHFSIQSTYSSFFVKEVIDSNEYKGFIDKMAKWHSSTELIFFYRWILNEYFGVDFDFKRETFLIEDNFKLTFRSYANKVVLKLLSKLFSACSLMPKFDDPFVTGFYLIITGTLFFHIPALTGLSSTVTKGVYGFTAYSFAMKKLSEYLNREGQMVEFRKLSEAVDQLDRKMSVLCYSFHKLIKAEMKRTSKRKDSDKDDTRDDLLCIEISSLKEKIEKDLKEINKEEKLEGETMKLIEMQIKEDENDWLIIDAHKAKEKK